MHWIDPESLPETRGQVARFIFNQHGDADGFLLDDGRQVHLPPHLSAELLRKVKVGDTAHIRGVRPRGAALVAAVALTTENGASIVDRGPHAKPPAPHRPRARKAVELHGVVRTMLHAPQGEVCGALLEGGEILRLHPHENDALAAYFEAGRHLAVWGEAFKVGRQVVVDLEHVALDE